MLINSQSFDLLYRGLNAKYRLSYDATPTHGAKVAMTMPSDGASEDYAWLGTYPGMREWIGPRVAANLSANRFTITNKTFESTVQVSRNHIEDDKIGLFAPMFSEMGKMAKQHSDELIFSLLAAGFSTPCYDGQFYFDTDHPVLASDGATVTTVSNFQGGSGTPWFLFDGSREIKPFIFQERLAPEFVTLNRPNDETVFAEDIYTFGVRRRCAVGYGLWQLGYGSRQTLNAANYAAGRAAMMSLKADGGRPLGVTPTILVVPPSLEADALSIVNVEYGAGGARNPWKGTAELVVSHWLA